VSAIDVRALSKGAAVNVEKMGVKVAIESVYAHCAPRRPGEGETLPEGMISIAGAISLDALPRETEPGKNRPGVVLIATNKDGASARVLLHAGHPHATELTLSDTPIYLQLRRKRSVLPATIQVLDFQKEHYPGSPVARKFSSRVSLKDGELEREILISMNKPMRYRGFTFYQSSYQTLPDGREASSLAVVKNHGRLMPYIATFMTAFGMMIHFTGQLFIHLRRSAANREAEA
jgi:hypothetical protein